ncbi:MAG TPA: hypothetical protein VNO30_47590 [Kofleriaceae bacterium]|nr:hypothetical protein [Kofleriaceae bacterium]
MIVWVLVATLCSGCSLVGVGRVSIGLTATTQGAVGLAVAGDVAAGVLHVPRAGAPSHGIGVTDGLYLGGGSTAEGWELETGGRVDLVMLDADSELRTGVRAGTLAREGRGPALAPELAFGLARASWWEPAAQRPRWGFELRAGPLIGIEGGATLEAFRGYAGLTYQATAISRRRDPIAALIGRPQGKH